LLTKCIQENNLQNYYPPNAPILDQIANRAPQQVSQLCAQWRIPQEIANDIVKLALFDVVIYIDDSGSMEFEEKGERIKDLRIILDRVAFAATLFDDDGISMRFMNNTITPDHVKSPQQIEQIMSQVRFSGLTPMGTKLREKVIDGIIRAQGQLRKPYLVITITDGQPAGENQTAVVDTIKYATTQWPRGSINFEFAQVGNDEAARNFLSKLDNDPMVGSLVDCTSSKPSAAIQMFY
jgi:D-lyxose ketol-isomerase